MSKTGTVKFFNRSKGFGFIQQEDGGEDLFAHANDIADGKELMEGDQVTYDSGYDEAKGKSNAQNITGGTGGEVGSGGKGKGKDGGKKGGGKGFRDRDDGYKGDKGFSKGFRDRDEGKGKSKGKGKIQANTVFVGGLSWGTTSDQLKEFFAEAGEIIYAGVMTERDTGRSKGCGKIEFADAAAMDRAVADWNQTELDGRTISVREFS